MKELKISQSLGVSSARYNAYRNINSHTIELPLGVSVVHWDLKAKRRTYMKQLHQHTIKFLSERPKNEKQHEMITQKNDNKSNIIVSSISDRGEMKLWIWNEKDLHLISRPLLLKHDLHHATWSPNGKYIICCTKSGTLYIVEVIDNDMGPDMHDIMRDDLEDDTIIYEENNSNSFSMSMKIIKKLKYKGLHTYACMDENSNNILCVLQDTDSYNTVKKCKIALLKNNKVIKHIKLKGISAVTIKQNPKGTHTAISFSDRSVRVYETSSMNLISNFKPKGTGRIRSMIFNEYLWIDSSNGILGCYNWKSKTGKCKKILKIPKQHSNLICFSTSKENDNDAMNESENDNNKENTNLLWLANETKLRLVNTKTSEDNLISYHGLTLCGIDFSPNGEFVAVGDFQSNVYIWNIKECKQVKRITLSSAIRAICWKGNSIQIGCLDGNISNWNTEDDTVTKLFNAKGGVTCLQWNNKGNILAAGTTDGYLILMEQKPCEKYMRTKLCIKAHKPVKSNSMFLFIYIYYLNLTNKYIL